MASKPLDILEKGFAKVKFSFKAQAKKEELEAKAGKKLTYL